MACILCLWALASLCVGGASGQAHLSTSQFCTGITSVNNLQDAIAANLHAESVCIKFLGDSKEQVWTLENAPALNIRDGQYVYIDCGGQYFNYHSKKGQLRMGKGSTLHYYNCSLLNYDFPDTNLVFGTVHVISWSTIGMQTCQVVKDLGDKYAPSLSKLQTNASFETGKLVENASGSAVYIFLTAFDSLAGPQYRYEITESTMYCKDADAAVPEAVRVAQEAGPEIRLYSEDVNIEPEQPNQQVQTDQSGSSDSKLWAFGVVAGVAVIVLGLAAYLLWYVKHKLGSKGGGPGADDDGTRYLAKHYGTSRSEVVSSSQMGPTSGPTSGSIDGRRYVPPNQ
eukprot:jgi/Ulvmu1/8455/UM043_0035.1